MATTDSTMHLRETQERDYPYFRRLWNSVVVALLAAAFIPLIVIGGGMYYYTVSVIEERTLENLGMELGRHSQAIDEFLSERTLDLKLLSSNLGLKHLTEPGNLERAFSSLQGEIPCFTDLGIIDDHGRHLAYVGPYDLLSKNYREAPWFKAILERQVYISDVFLGFRNEPHFIIAVKQNTAEGFWIIRATVDTIYFENMVKNVLGERSGHVFIVNSDGDFQAAPGSVGEIVGQGGLRYLKYFEGTRLERTSREILAMTWLKKVPWVCVVKFDRNEIYRSLRNMRTVAGAVLGLGALIIVLTVLLTTNYLFTRLETKRRSIRFLDQQLRHSSRMASSMKMAEGSVREINDSLSNVDLVLNWLEELSHRDLAKEANQQELRESLDQIKSEVSRSRKATDMFLKAARPSMPIIGDMRVSDVLDEIVELLDRELRFNRITVKRDYPEAAPIIRSDPSQLRQVFQNLILNAVTAIRKDGQITLQVRPEGEGVSVSVSDTGHGIPHEMQKKIFDPLFTTKPEGTGLGLSIGAGIVEKLGGRISVASEPGKGATFTVVLPYRFRTTKDIG
jgi:two-component system, NtrC family, sensor kinase